MEKITKQYDNVIIEANEGKREVVSIINTDAIDRDSEVVQPKGMKRKNYAGNPVVLVNHNRNTLPVGKSLWIKSTTVDNRDVVIAKTYFSDKTELSRDVFGLLQDGVLNGFSIGFNSLRASAPSTKEINLRPDLKGAKLIHREWELMEYSVVGIPCNQEALTLAVSKGCGNEIIDFLTTKHAIEVEKQIVEAVVVPPEIKLTKKDVEGIIAKRLEQLTIAIDPDRIVANAMKRIERIVG